MLALGAVRQALSFAWQLEAAREPVARAMARRKLTRTIMAGCLSELEGFVEKMRVGCLFQRRMLHLLKLLTLEISRKKLCQSFPAVNGFSAG
jgi:hypothetical protein